MIISKYRKKKFGKRVAFDCFEMFKGNWEVSTSYGDESAHIFWKKVIDEYTSSNNEYKNKIFTINNKHKEDRLLQY